MYKDFVYFVIFVMKKISLVVLISFIALCTNLSFWENSLCESELWYPPCIGGEYDSSCTCILDWTDPDWWTPEWWDWWCDCSMGPFTEECTLVCNWWNAWWCDPNRVYTITDWLTWCCPSPLVNWSCNTVEYGDIWMKMDTECLLNWQCSLNVYKVLWIRKSNPNPTVWWLFQDVVLAATTFVWTVIVIALIVSWLIFAFGSISWKDTKRAKTIMIDCFIWLLMVMWSYTIIRLIQFLATAGS